MPSIPTHFGRYQVRSVVAQTSMSSVYEAWDERIGRRVAIKAVSFGDCTDFESREMLARFARGARAAGMLSHRNIVSVYDYSEQDGVAWLVMEFIDGVTLKTMLDGGRVLPVARTATILEEVLQGLSYSHEHGVVHRDIKPANIMLPEGGEARITDFGIARIERSDLTQAGMLMGTPAYMSPEQFRGERVGHRSDIYSVGVILYQMLAGRRPYEGGLATIMHKALNTEPPAPSSFGACPATAFDAVVRRAMAKRVEDRFASAREFAQAIRAAAAATPPDTAAPNARVAAAPSRRAEKALPAGAVTARRRERPGRRLVAAGAGGLVAVAALAAAWVVPRWPGAPRRTAAPAASLADATSQAGAPSQPALPAAGATPPVAPPTAAAAGPTAVATDSRRSPAGQPVPAAAITAPVIPPVAVPAASASPPPASSPPTSVATAAPATREPMPPRGDAAPAAMPIPPAVQGHDATPGAAAAVTPPPPPAAPSLRGASAGILHPPPAGRTGRSGFSGSGLPGAPEKSQRLHPSEAQPGPPPARPDDGAGGERHDNLPPWLRHMASDSAGRLQPPPPTPHAPQDDPAAPLRWTAASSSPLGLLWRGAAEADSPERLRRLEVMGVTIGSPADIAGIRRGDTITAIDGHPVSDPGALTALTTGSAAAGPATIEISRDGKTRTVSVMATARSR